MRAPVQGIYDLAAALCFCSFQFSFVGILAKRLQGVVMLRNAKTKAQKPHANDKAKLINAEIRRSHM